MYQNITLENPDLKDINKNPDFIEYVNWVQSQVFDKATVGLQNFFF